eukprot:NODE_913_length_1770_cov_25.969568_g857_i0.p1 GENE.NODE_913_length_1770_cov_25.969568_g857_i0~~NODE_913_length_1770_cov_25.969568_g857_i0.p1  ORF type:complete len:546 (-),score=99.77 NODE_913_length_1770_cov_25.969568_g857_i0:19-1656(-)
MTGRRRHPSVRTRQKPRLLLPELKPVDPPSQLSQYTQKLNHATHRALDQLQQCSSTPWASAEEVVLTFMTEAEIKETEKVSAAQNETEIANLMSFIQHSRNYFNEPETVNPFALPPLKLKLRKMLKPTPSARPMDAGSRSPRVNVEPTQSPPPPPPPPQPPAKLPRIKPPTHIIDRNISLTKDWPAVVLERHCAANLAKRRQQLALERAVALEAQMVEYHASKASHKTTISQKHAPGYIYLVQRWGTFISFVIRGQFEAIHTLQRLLQPIFKKWMRRRVVKAFPKDSPAYASMVRWLSLKHERYKHRVAGTMRGFMIRFSRVFKFCSVMGHLQARILTIQRTIRGAYLIRCSQQLVLQAQFQRLEEELSRTHEQTFLRDCRTLLQAKEEMLQLKHQERRDKSTSNPESFEQLKERVTLQLKTRTIQMMASLELEHQPTTTRTPFAVLLELKMNEAGDDSLKAMLQQYEIYHPLLPTPFKLQKQLLSQLLIDKRREWQRKWNAWKSGKANKPTPGALVAYAQMMSLVQRAVESTNSHLAATELLFS